MKQESRSARWRKADLKRRWNMTVDQYDEMLVKQKSTCAICGNLGKTNLHIDHNHDTGRIRGLLCFSCNSKLPMVEDENWREAAIKYLEKYDNQSLST
jgi:hypothetical protein